MLHRDDRHKAVYRRRPRGSSIRSGSPFLDKLSGRISCRRSMTALDRWHRKVGKVQHGMAVSKDVGMLVSASSRFARRSEVVRPCW